MKDTIRTVSFKIREYKYDLLTLLSAVVLISIALLNAGDQRGAFIFSVLVTFLSFAIIVYLRSKDKDFFFISFTKREDKDDWIGGGIFEYVRVNKCFHITNTDPGGYIFSKCLTWSDYKYEFEFKIVNKCLGAVVRAVNLSNLVMLQITESGIRAHICINGGWFVWEIKNTGLSFAENLSHDKWYRCQIFCEKQDITIKIYEETELMFDKQWRIPGGKIEFSFPKDDQDVEPIKIPFPINLEYGSAGFRNSGDEKALVKNVLVEKI